MCDEWIKSANGDFDYEVSVDKKKKERRTHNEWEHIENKRDELTEMMCREICYFEYYDCIMTLSYLLGWTWLTQQLILSNSLLRLLEFLLKSWGLGEDDIERF